MESLRNNNPQTKKESSKYFLFNIYFYSSDKLILNEVRLGIEGAGNFYEKQFEIDNETHFRNVNKFVDKSIGVTLIMQYKDVLQVLEGRLDYLQSGDLVINLNNSGKINFSSLRLDKSNNRIEKPLNMTWSTYLTDKIHISRKKSPAHLESSRVEENSNTNQGESDVFSSLLNLRECKLLFI